MQLKKRYLATLAVILAGTVAAVAPMTASNAAR